MKSEECILNSLEKKHWEMSYWEKIFSIVLLLCSLCMIALLCVHLPTNNKYIYRTKIGDIPIDAGSRSLLADDEGVQLMIASTNYVDRNLNTFKKDFNSKYRRNDDLTVKRICKLISDENNALVVDELEDVLMKVVYYNVLNNSDEEAVFEYAKGTNEYYINDVKIVFELPYVKIAQAESYKIKSVFACDVVEDALVINSTLKNYITKDDGDNLYMKKGETASGAVTESKVEEMLKNYATLEHFIIINNTLENQINTSKNTEELITSFINKKYVEEGEGNEEIMRKKALDNYREKNNLEYENAGKKDSLALKSELNNFLDKNAVDLSISEKIKDYALENHTHKEFLDIESIKEDYRRYDDLTYGVYEELCKANDRGYCYVGNLTPKTTHRITYTNLLTNTQSVITFTTGDDVSTPMIIEGDMEINEGAGDLNLLPSDKYKMIRMEELTNGDSLVLGADLKAYYTKGEVDSAIANINLDSIFSETDAIKALVNETRKEVKTINDEYRRKDDLTYGAMYNTYCVAAGGYCYSTSALSEGITYKISYIIKATNIQEEAIITAKSGKDEWLVKDDIKVISSNSDLYILPGDKYQLMKIDEMIGGDFLVLNSTFKDFYSKSEVDAKIADAAGGTGVYLELTKVNANLKNDGVYEEKEVLSANAVIGAFALEKSGEADEVIRKNALEKYDYQTASDVLTKIQSSLNENGEEKYALASSVNNSVLEIVNEKNYTTLAAVEKLISDKSIKIFRELDVDGELENALVKMVVVLENDDLLYEGLLHFAEGVCMFDVNNNEKIIISAEGQKYKVKATKNNAEEDIKYFHMILY